MQAVRYLKLLLLASVCFSGFFLDLMNLNEQVQALSYFLPVTYAIQLLQDIILRGSSLNPLKFTGLIGIGLMMFVLVWNMLYRWRHKEWDKYNGRIICSKSRLVVKFFTNLNILRYAVLVAWLV